MVTYVLFLFCKNVEIIHNQIHVSRLQANHPQRVKINNVLFIASLIAVLPKLIHVKKKDHKTGQIPALSTTCFINPIHNSVKSKDTRVID